MPYKVNRRGKTSWRGQITIRGRKITRQFETKSEAKEWEALANQRANKILEPATTQTTTPSVSCLEWLTRYILYAQRYVPKTFSEKKCEASRFLKSMADPKMPVAEVSPGHALAHLQVQFEARSGYAANKVRKNLAAAWAWGVKYLEGFPQGKPNPFYLVDPFPSERQERYVPPESDFWQAYDVAQGQDRVLLTALYCTAARKGELFRWRWSRDIDFIGRKVRLGSRKNKTGDMVYRWLPMLDDLHDALTEHREQMRSVGSVGSLPNVNLKNEQVPDIPFVGSVGSLPNVFSENDWVFVQSVGRHAGKPYKENRDFPQELCRKAGVPEFGCHGVRHLVAGILAKRNIPLVAIQTILRHAKLTTTERYIKSLTGEDTRPHMEALAGGKCRIQGKSLPINLPKEKGATS